MQTTYHEITCKSALNKLKHQFPYKWDLNIYRGCEHGCKYCYAIYSHEYLSSGNFFQNIFIKTNVVDELEKKLKSKKWEREVVNIGGVTDSYQPAEEVYKLMPFVLKLLIKYKTPAVISTKSTLVLRDFDLIDELSRITYINIAATVTSMDEETRLKIEPNATTSQERFAMLKEFRKTNASVGLHFMPIAPFITDSFQNINSLFNAAKNADVHYILTGVMNLRGATRQNFFTFIKNSYPELFDKYKELYKTGGANVEYKNNLYRTLNSLKAKHCLSSSYGNVMKEKLNQS